MLISSMFDYISPSSNSSGKGWWLQGKSIADAIKQAASDAAAKRKALAAERLKMLAERLRVLMLLSSADGKGSKRNIETAGGIAKEIAATVKDYAGASADIAAQAATGGDSSTPSTGTNSTVAAATTNTQGLSSEDEAFLNTAIQLSSQVKAFIAIEIQKARHKHENPDTHQAGVNVMDNAIIDAAKSLGHDDAPKVPLIPFTTTIISINA